MRRVSTLIVAALKVEYDALLEAGLCGVGRDPGVAAWQDSDSSAPVPYVLGDYITADGAHLCIALARPTRQGSNAISPVGSSLVEHLKPRCLAMSGVCAGNPAEVALGDVIVAELAYAYDEGRRTNEGFEGDHRQFLLPDHWVRTAQDLPPAEFRSYGEAGEAEAKVWLLERLYSGDQPREHPARSRYFSENSWKNCVDSLESAGLITRNGLRLSLTEKGEAFTERSICDHVAGPTKLPFKVAVGPMATGNVVVKDGLTWNQLKQWGVRTVLALDMEAAAIASIAYRLRVPEWIVVKGVMDHADPRKDDRYKKFAAQASAEVLLSLLTQRLISKESRQLRRLLRKNSTIMEMQEFLTRNPQIFARWRTVTAPKILPSVSLGGIFANFAIGNFQVTTGVWEWTLVNLEHPDDEIFTQDGEPSASLDRAFRTGAGWRAWIQSNPDSARQALPDVSPQVSIAILIGRRCRVREEDRERITMLRISNPGFIVNTYDSLIESAEAGER